MSESLEELLTEWGFADDLEEFLNFNLDHKTILYLNDKQLETLFDGKMGKIINFKLCLSKHIKEKVCSILFLIFCQFLN